MKGLMLLFMIVIFVTGCLNQPKSKESTKAKSDNEITKIHKSKVETYEGSLTAEEIEEDIDGDGTKETIKLLISPAPQPDPTNENTYLWGDSHIWQLIVEDEGNAYPLFNDYVQGLAELYIVNEGERENVIAFQTKGTILSLTLYKYNPKDYFEKRVIYSNGSILHRSTMK
ncbi:hypothetical protein [Pseudalkalibacillus sp. SCS-8]|uniref:hypothetical protein n=1 Tax=Pseudalkalibacillus nanhaiensis TaxID=3115291 RepID=UPI0032DB3D79